MTHVLLAEVAYSTSGLNKNDNDCWLLEYKKTREWVALCWPDAGLTRNLVCESYTMFLSISE